MTRDCMALGHSYFRHFPAGDYYRQTATAAGRIELELMRHMERCWLTFFIEDASTYSKASLKLIGWLERDERTEQTDKTIARIWKIKHGRHDLKLSD